MPIETASPATFGYRKLPSSSATLPDELVKRLTRLGDYEEMPPRWIRRRGRRTGTAIPPIIETIGVFEADTPLDDDALAFIDAHARSKWTEMENQWVRFRGDFQDLTDLVANAASEDRWRAMYRLIQAMFLAGPEHLRPMLRNHIAPRFFSFYPQGKIVVLRYNMSVDESAASARILYSLAQAPLSDLTDGDFRGVRTMWQWHLTSLSGLMAPVLAFFNHLFYPFVGGASANLHGLTFLFLMDPPERHEPASFPRNWLGFASRSASFGREAADAVEVMESIHSPAHRRQSHHRHCHEQGFSADQRLDLLTWYIQRWNSLLYELTDVANFTKEHNPDAEIDPVFAYEHQLTVDRLFRKTILAMSLDEAPAANLTAFEIADLYDTLSTRFRNRKASGAAYQAVEFFKTLFHPHNGPQILVPRFGGMPPPFAEYFTALTNVVYQKIEQTVKDSIWRSSKITPTGVLVRDEDLAHEAEMSVSDFVAELMRCYRNAHHGYFSADHSAKNRPSRFLYLVDGNLPVEMSALPVLWWLAYLADPNMVGWNHLPVGSFP